MGEVLEGLLRISAKASDLLWANIDVGYFRKLYFECHDMSDVETKVFAHREASAEAFQKFHMYFGDFVPRIADTETREIAMFGCSRRIGSIDRNFQIVTRHFYHGRAEPLTLDEASAASDAVCLIYTHLSGVLDSLCRFVLLQKPTRGGLTKNQHSFIEKKFWKEIDWLELKTALAPHKEWMHRVKREYRQMVAHDFPIYVPYASYTTEEFAEYNRYEKEKFAALRNGELDEFERLRELQFDLGKAYPVMVLHDGGYTHIFPTLSEDVLQLCVVCGAIFSVVGPDLELKH